MTKKISLIMITIIALSLIIPFKTAYAEGTTIQIVPPTSTVPVGTSFTVNITVTNVTDLAVWEVQIFYLNAILNCSKAVKGPFLQKDGHSQFFASTINNAYNTTHGWILVGASRIGNWTGVSGSGTLATITFKAKAAGITPLHLTDTSLKDSTPPPRHPISHTAIDGTVTAVLEEFHDVAITDVKPWHSVEARGFKAKINVTVVNEGNFDETFNVTVYADLALPIGDEVTIGEQKVTNLVAGETRVLLYIWDTTGATQGNYTISAVADAVSDETDLTDNTFIDNEIMISKLGDLNTDGIVNYKDASLFRQAYVGTYNYLADFNQDSVINYKDASLFRSYYISG
jgi:hypothetical protein